MKEGRREWINRSDVEEWAIGYLQRRMLRHPDQEPAEKLYGRLASRGKRFISDADKDLLKLMRGAWSQKQSRSSTTEKKPASFVLSLKSAKDIGRLARDWGLTKRMALERIISDALKQENSYKTTKREESIYKMRFEILSRHLGSVLDELYEFKALSDHSGLNVDQRAASLQEAQRISRKRKQELMAELPALPVSPSRKAKKKYTKRGDHAAETSAHSSQIPLIYSAASQEKSPSGSSLEYRAGDKRGNESNPFGAPEHNALNDRATDSESTPQAPPFTVVPKGPEPESAKTGQPPHHHADAHPDLSSNATQPIIPEQKQGWTDEKDEELKKLLYEAARRDQTSEPD